MADLQTEQRLESLEEKMDSLLKISQLPNSNLPPITSYVPIFNPGTNQEEKLQLEGLNFSVSYIGETNVEVFGAKGDGIQLSDWSVTGTTLSSPSVTFSDTDVNKIVSVADAGASGEHLVANIVSVDTGANTATLDTAATTNVSVKLGSYGTDNMKPMQDACDFAILNNVKLIVPEGVYIVGDVNPDNATFKQIRLQFTQDNQNFYLQGAGKGLTTFLELDGKTQRIGNFTTIFYCNFPATTPVGKISFTDCTLDKNGRSLTIAPSPISAWEQAHAINFVKTSTGASTLQSLNIASVEFKDKIGGGIAFNTMNNTVDGVNLIDITSIDYAGVGGAIEYGQRGDIEMHAVSEKMTVDNVNIGYMQFEPSGSYASNATRRRTMYISNSKIDDLEPTEVTSTAQDVKYHKLFMNNVVSKSFTARGLSWSATNCELTIKETVNSVDGEVLNSKIYLPYDDVLNSVGTLSFVNYPNIPNKMRFLKSDILIDSDDLAITPTGYAVTSTENLDSLSDNYIEFVDCSFDSRFESCFDAQSNGTWHIENCLVAGRVRVALAGAISTYTSKLTLKGNDYSQVPDDQTTVYISNNNTNWLLEVIEEIPFNKWKTGTTGSVGDPNLQILRHPVLLIDDVANRSGFRRQGENFKIINPAAGEYANYIVTTSGSGLGSVVKGYGLLES